MIRTVDSLIEALDNVCKHRRLKVSDDCLLEQAVKIHLSDLISEQKSSGKTSEKASQKQIDLLYKLNANFNAETITKSEAHKLIKELKE